MKFGPVSKLDKIAKQRQKNLTMTNFDVGKFRHHCRFSNFWPMWSNLEAVFQTLEAVFKSVKFIFSFKVIFYLTKTEKRTKKYLTQLSHYCFKQSTIFAKNTDFLQKNADISKIKRALVLKATLY